MRRRRWRRRGFIINRRHDHRFHLFHNSSPIRYQIVVISSMNRHSSWIYFQMLSRCFHDAIEMLRRFFQVFGCSRWLSRPMLKIFLAVCWSFWKISANNLQLVFICLPFDWIFSGWLAFSRDSAPLNWTRFLWLLPSPFPPNKKKQINNKISANCSDLWRFLYSKWFWRILSRPFVIGFNVCEIPRDSTALLLVRSCWLINSADFKTKLLIFQENRKRTLLKKRLSTYQPARSFVSGIWLISFKPLNYLLIARWP